MKDILSYALVGLIIGGCVFYFIHSTRVKERERQLEEQRIHLQEEQTKLRQMEEARKRAEEEIKREQERKRQEEDVRRRKEEDRRKAAEAEKARLNSSHTQSKEPECEKRIERPVEPQREVVMRKGGRMDELLAYFGQDRKTRVDWWKNCPMEDRPENTKQETTFAVLSFCEQNGRCLMSGWEITADKSSPFKRVVRIDFGSERREESSEKDFQDASREGIQLLKLGRDWYLKENGTVKTRGTIRMHSNDEKTTASALRFGPVQSFLLEQGIVLPEVPIRIEFDPKDKKSERAFKVKDISGEEALSKADVFEKVRQYLEWQNRQTKSSTAKKQTKPSRRKRGPRVTFAPPGTLVNVQKKIDGSFVIARNFRGQTGHDEWMRLRRLAVEQEKEALTVMNAVPDVSSPRVCEVTDSDVMSAMSSGVITWRVL